MQVTPFSESERAEILRRYRKALETRARLVEQEDYDLARAYSSKVRQAKEAYFKRLPRLTMSCCPFDGKPLVRTFDPYGMDGLWWNPDAKPEELPCCPHFCVLRGAVHFAGEKPYAGKFQAQPGPEVPYVIPRLLDYPGMIVVIAQIKMAPGYLAYPIAYFAERRPPPDELTADWGRGLHTYRMSSGETGWNVPTDPWDFDLKPWLAKGKIRWCPPGSDNTFLSTGPPETCPYVDLPGIRERFIVEGDVAWTHGLPDGASVSRMD